jgi:hypothetical protein
VEEGTYACIEGEFPNLCVAFPTIREGKQERNEVAWGMEEECVEHTP